VKGEQIPLFGAEPVAATVVDADTAARDFARDPANNVVLEASAGTGKTSVLVARYINLLGRGVDPANILAITFTRKAAAEMRERIVRELRRAAAQASFDRGRWASIRNRLADIQISTIDAFCLALLREFPLEADLDPGFGMADETDVPRLVDQSLDRSLATFVARATREPDIALVLAPRAEAASDGSSWDVSYPQIFDIRGPLVIGFVVGFWWMLRRRADHPTKTV